MKQNGMIPIVEGQNWRPKWLKDIEIKDGITMSGLITHVGSLQKAFNQLADNMKNATIIEKDKEYIIEIDGELKRVTNPEMYESTDLKLPIKFYKIENKKIVLDTMKAGAL